MTALLAPRTNGLVRTTQFSTLPVKGATTIFAGAIVCLDATGYAVPGSLSATLVTYGIAEETVVNAGADGAKNIVVRTSAGEVEFLVNNDGTNPCAITHVGKDVYVLDDNVVRSLSTGASIAGKCMGVTAAGVWIRFPF